MTNIIKSICMNRFFLFVFLQLVFFSAISQVQTHVVGDSVRIHSNNGKGEFILQNATDSVKGFLFNKGAGRTEFRKGLVRINDSLYLIGADTLRISVSGATGNLSLQQVTLVGDSTSNRIVVRKLITDTINTHNSTLWLDNVPVKLIKPDYSFPSTGVYDIISIGDSALVKNTSNSNLAVGSRSLRDNTTGTKNTALGLYSERDNTTGSYNTGVGYTALQLNTTGSSNTGVGHGSLRYHVSGDANTALGVSSGVYQKTGSGNTAIGVAAMYGSPNGAGAGSAAANVAVGYNALSSNSIGNNNVAIGYQTLSDDTSGSNNVAIGFQAGDYNVTGSNNICIGYQAGRNQGQYSNRLYISNIQTATPLIYGDFSTNSLTFNGSVTTTGKQIFSSTITPGGTITPQTINKPSGTINIGQGVTTVTVTNNLVTPTSIVMAVIRTADSTALIKNVVPQTGSFIINLSGAPANEISIGFIVYNN